MRNNNLTRPNPFYRGLAIFFLVFTALDLSSPTLCRGDGLEGSAIADLANRPVQSVAWNQGPSSDPSKHDSSEDIEEHDCFCCCTHLTLVYLTRIVDLNVGPQIATTNVGDPSVASPHGIYHPPRLA